MGDGQAIDRSKTRIKSGNENRIPASGIFTLLRWCIGSAMPGLKNSLISTLLCWSLFARRAHEARHVEDQHDAALAEYRGPGDECHLAIVALEALDHHLLLADEPVDEERNLVAL